MDTYVPSAVPGIVINVTLLTSALMLPPSLVIVNDANCTPSVTVYEVELNPTTVDMKAKRHTHVHTHMYKAPSSRESKLNYNFSKTNSATAMSSNE